MATLTMSHSRQPLGALDSPRLQSLTRTKMNLVNQKNGIPTAKTTTAKYTPDIHLDTENIDPLTLHQSSKRKRSSDELDEPAKTKSSKTSRIALKTVGIENENENTNRTPRPLHHQIPSTPKSAPAPFATRKPAGRSPTSTKTAKSCRPFARRMTGNGVKSRVEPSRKKSMNMNINRPFSLATALSSGTKPKPRAPTLVTEKPTPARAPASWFFDIHVDSEEDEMTNLMQHSTTVLDITDDEGKTSGSGLLGEGLGKENIPPVDVGVDAGAGPATRRVSRKEEVSRMDEDRSPLGELDARGFYSDGCDAFSYEVVFEEGENDKENENGESGKKCAGASRLRESWEGDE